METAYIWAMLIIMVIYDVNDRKEERKRMSILVGVAILIEFVRIISTAFFL